MIKFFNQISTCDSLSCGGKGSSLGELTQNGFNVPDGFVLTTDAFGKDPVEWSSKVYAAFDTLDTKFVAVRSSGTKEDGNDDSFAGQFDTYLFVTREQVIEKIIECHNSLCSDRMVSYCDSKGIIMTDIKIAVVIQKMINSEVAGVCFTVNPINYNANEIMIDAGFGLGEAVVSGIITPDNYIVHKNSLGIIQSSISHQEKKLVINIDHGGLKEEMVEETEQSVQKLSDRHIRELSIMARDIEKHYGRPMDIEWALENNTLYILQARPITTLPDIYKDLSFCFNRGFVFKSKYENLGPHTNDIRQSEESAWLIYDIIGQYRGMFSYWDMRNDVISSGHYIDKEIPEKFLQHINTWREKDRTFLERKLSTFFDIQEEVKKNFLDYDYNIDKMTHLQIIEKYKECRRYYHKLGAYDHITWMIEEINDIYVRDVFENIVMRNLQINDINERKERLFAILIKSHRPSSTLQQEIALLKSVQKVIHGESTIGEESQTMAFLYGAIPIGTNGQERDVSHYEDRINILLQIGIEGINTMLYKLETSIGASLLSEKETIYKELFINETERQVFSDFEILTDVRNECGCTLGIITRYLRKVMEYVAKKLCLSEQSIDLLYEHDIINCLEYNYEAKSIIDNRPKIFGFYNTADFFKRIFINDKRFVENLLTHIKGNTEIHLHSGEDGLCAYPGIYEGFARIVNNSQENSKVEKGDIMIAFATLVDYLPAMKNAGAMVTEYGGLTCHTAVVAREFDIPCIVGKKGIMQSIKDGSRIRVDAGKCTVEII